MSRGFADLRVEPLHHVARERPALGRFVRTTQGNAFAGMLLAAPRGFEPRLTDPKSAVLPLDEGAAARSLVGCRVGPGKDIGAEDGTRTRDPHLGKVMLYQLSHFRSNDAHRGGGAESQIRTGDTAIFSRVLYQLSYLGPIASQASVARRLAQDSMPRPTVSSRRRPPRGCRARQSRPASSATSDGSSWDSPVSWRSRLMRSTTGGWVDMKSLDRSSQRLTGLVK